MSGLRKATLRVDACCLALAGAFGLIGDILSYVSGAGPFGATFHDNPTVVGVVEAHSLAVLTAVALWHSSRNHVGTFGNVVERVAAAAVVTRQGSWSWMECDQQALYQE